MKNGQTVSLYVRSVNPDGTLRIQVAGVDVTARSEIPGRSPVSAGSVLKGTVFFEDGRVCIKIAQDASPRNFSTPAFLSAHGLPGSPAALFTAAFFYASGKRIDPDCIRRITALSAGFPGGEFHACEAAALLLQKGLPLTDENLRKAVRILEGGAEDPSEAAENGASGEKKRGVGDGSPHQDFDAADSSDDSDGSGESSAADGEGRERAREDGDGFYRRFTEGGAEDEERFSWRVIPWRRDFAGRGCAGSVRFLIDNAVGATVETRISVMDGAASADFIISGGVCRLETSAPLGLREREKIAGELKRMADAADVGLDVVYGFGGDVPPVGSVDIEV